MTTISKGVDVAAGTYPYDLGKFTFSVSTHTRSAHAQQWFNRGIIWCYGYHHEEAIRCFDTALAIDNKYVMAMWGKAYAGGPNYNKPWEAFLEEERIAAQKACYDTTQRALDVIHHDHGSEGYSMEAALVVALAKRYQTPRCDDMDTLAKWNMKYAEAMGEVGERFANDVNFLTLAAEAYMNITPWQLWDLQTGAPTEFTPKILHFLDRGLELQEIEQRARCHHPPARNPGLLHMYIHVWEMSPTPEKALLAADHLRDLCPDVGHLRHMPSHLDIQCGHYHAALEANSRAIVADRKMLEHHGPLNFYTLYRCHDYHFKIYAALFMGQYDSALSAANELIETVPTAVLEQPVPPMADWVEGFLGMKYHVFVRFGRWQELVDEPFPSNPALYCTTTALLHYAKGIAHASMCNVEKAEEQQRLFLAAKALVPESRTLFNNKTIDILGVAEAMLEGEVEYRKGNYDAAFERLRESGRRETSLPYDEPWGWMQPTRHALGALQLEQGRVEDALLAYEEDLGIGKGGGRVPRSQWHPDNVWGLQGYVECLDRLGRQADADDWRLRLNIARARADLPVNVSCFCRLKEHSDAK